MRKITEREGKREWKYTQKTNRNIKLLSPTKSLCSVVQHIQERGRDRNRAKVSSSLKRVYESLSALSLLISCCFLGGEVLLFPLVMYLRRDRGCMPKKRVVLMFSKASWYQQTSWETDLFSYLNKGNIDFSHHHGSPVFDICISYFFILLFTLKLTNMSQFSINKILALPQGKNLQSFHSF